ncbi:DUF1501 domain-containing protein [Ketogulonicigenium vulgare]|uniref:DUF1501 domain-containing protein n=1 Tax=Ketogulonicigenium vulgare (strain WSH-001) TaxID=759362 RepID=F9Y5J4_KETVW|nr:DUF1501 domain-containing protein [Ketogulonicigenium vulgare]ADO42552.1 conserved hypothetical protein [Ketogulonicigenium vulgare Y25]AEM40747.1 hypothetical protein KVU_0908 [Ketogulonicigenium vulgare WSH-001]ALJ80916.1 hypothetical protein KVH_06825 [Ketogulonicigenium vulgare]ANW33687.1 hypothetical protein KvSKV_06795 [Ketogulonicigenium vulgare]AOZ54465.1 hypothetical protein KVC_1451 [Ketogulonicigenium vulgare]
MAKTPKLTSAERDGLIRDGYSSLVMEGAGGITTSPVFSKVAGRDQGDKILVIVELSGGNDGLNTVIPYQNDAYYNARPHLGIRKNNLIPIDDTFGFQKTMTGFERLFKDGNMGLIHGVGYDQPSFSHFSSMAFWQTGAPNSGEAYGWLGRMADALDPLGHNANLLVNIDDHQSLAVRAMNHVPLVFDAPEKFTRRAYHEQADVMEAIDRRSNGAGNASLDFMMDIAASASQSEQLVRDAWNAYATPVDYGLVRFGLERVAALVAADFPTRVYYVPYRNNAFDTHVYQGDLHARLWSYTSDHIAAFVADMERLGRGDDVVVMVFSEFGRRVAENTSLGTDHGTAGPAFIIGKPVLGGHYGAMPSLSDLDDGNLKYTTDFRRIYSTLIKGWMGHDKVSQVLHDDFSPFKMFKQ